MFFPYQWISSCSVSENHLGCVLKIQFTGPFFFWRFWLILGICVFNRHWSDWLRRRRLPSIWKLHPSCPLVPFPIEQVFLSAKSDITFWILLMCQARLTTLLEILALWEFCELLNYTIVVSPGSKKYPSSPNKKWDIRIYNLWFIFLYIILILCATVNAKSFK